MNELQAVTAQLHIVEGVLQESGVGQSVPGVLIQPTRSRPARGRERDFLFVHLTLTGATADTADLSRHLLMTLSHQFYSAGGSITAALRGAVLEANQQLLRHNLGGKGPTREGAVSAVVFRQGELFTLQAGESFALLGHNFGIERMPPKAPAQVTPLGRSSGLDIRYYHHRVQSGDMLLLADPRVSHLPTEEFNAALVESTIETGMAALVTMIGDDSARLLLVEFSREAPVDLPDVQPQTTAPDTAVPMPQPRREGVATAGAATAVSPPAARKPQTQQPIRQQPVTPGTAGSAVSAPAIDREVVERQARRAGSQAALGASRFTAWLADLLARLRPPQSAGQGETVNWAWAAAVALVIPVLVAAIVTGVYLARDQRRTLDEIKAVMAQDLSLAESAATDTEARHYYEQVLALADQANTQLDPGDIEVRRMQGIARENKDKLDGVTRLTAVAFYQFSHEGTNLKAVALREGANGGIFTLDAGNSIVYEHETDETYLNLLASEPRRVLFAGQTVGSHIAGTVADFFWRPQGFAVQREGLAMLDSAGALLTYQPSLDSIFAVPLDLSIDWVNPIAATDFDERLYVLDSGTRQIWKYFPDGEAFIAKADERAIVFSDDPDLANAVDFDLYSEDGSLVLLYNDGRIRYYDTRNGRIEWDESILLANGLNTPLINPTAVEIVGRGLNATVYIADAGNGRIVQVSRATGQVLAQFRATAKDGSELFLGLTDFALAELPLRVFVIKGDTLYKATIE